MSLKIPKIIHMIWIGPDECPYEKSIDSYKRNDRSGRLGFGIMRLYQSLISTTSGYMKK